MNEGLTSALGLRLPRATSALLPLAFINGVTVSSLYWGQAVISRAAADFGPSTAVNLMPGATLLGYAGGVAGLAALVRDLSAPRGLAWHFVLLAAALGAAAAASSAVTLTISCLFVGIGCSLTQRLLAVASAAVPRSQRAMTIGWIIAAGLCGIVVARAGVPAASVWLGWHRVFSVAALLVCLGGAAAVMVAARVFEGAPAARGDVLPGVAVLWRREVILRRAALQQAAVFAAFNLGWAVFPRVAGPEMGLAGPGMGLAMGLVAWLGAAAALLAGRACSSLGAGCVAVMGACAVLLGSAGLVLGCFLIPGVYVAMVLLDTGTQAALVANQARAQSLAPNAALRGRLAAIVTTVGFIGGALGSTLGNLLAANL